MVEESFGEPFDPGDPRHMRALRRLQAGAGVLPSRSESDGSDSNAWLRVLNDSDRGLQVDVLAFPSPGGQVLLRGKLSNTGTADLTLSVVAQQARYRYYTVKPPLAITRLLLPAGSSEDFEMSLPMQRDGRQSRDSMHLGVFSGELATSPEFDDALIGDRNVRLPRVDGNDRNGVLVLGTIPKSADDLQWVETLGSDDYTYGTTISGDPRFNIPADATWLASWRAILLIEDLVPGSAHALALEQALRAGTTLFANRESLNPPTQALLQGWLDQASPGMPPEYRYQQITTYESTPGHSEDEYVLKALSRSLNEKEVALLESSSLRRVGMGTLALANHDAFSMLVRPFAQKPTHDAAQRILPDLLHNRFEYASKLPLTERYVLPPFLATGLLLVFFVLTGPLLVIWVRARFPARLPLLAFGVSACLVVGLYAGISLWRAGAEDLRAYRVGVLSPEGNIVSQAEIVGTRVDDAGAGLELASGTWLHALGGGGYPLRLETSQANLKISDTGVRGWQTQRLSAVKVGGVIDRTLKFQWSPSDMRLIPVGTDAEALMKQSTQVAVVFNTGREIVTSSNRQQKQEQTEPNPSPLTKLWTCIASTVTNGVADQWSPFTGLGITPPESTEDLEWRRIVESALNVQVNVGNLTELPQLLLPEMAGLALLRVPTGTLPPLITSGDAVSVDGWDLLIIPLHKALPREGAGS